MAAECHASRSSCTKEKYTFVTTTPCSFQQCCNEQKVLRYGGQQLSHHHHQHEHTAKQVLILSPLLAASQFSPQHRTAKSPSPKMLLLSL